MISPTRRSLPDNTQHPQQTDIHASGGIRTHTSSNRAAADPRVNTLVNDIWKCLWIASTYTDMLTGIQKSYWRGSIRKDLKFLRVCGPIDNDNEINNIHATRNSLAA